MDYPPPSPAYRLFEQAMREGEQIRCRYGGHLRDLSAIVLGHAAGEEKALTFQFGGASSSRLPPGGEWRCLFLAKVTDAELRDGPRLTGASHSRPQGCVEDVDLDVNPLSPFHPRRRL